jgi:hypothetical protein
VALRTPEGDIVAHFVEVGWAAAEVLGDDQEEGAS